MPQKIIYNSKKELAEASRIDKEAAKLPKGDKRKAFNQGAAATYRRWAKEDAPRKKANKKLKR